MVNRSGVIVNHEAVVDKLARDVVAIRLNRPHKANALNDDLVTTLHSAFDAAVCSGSRLVVFLGTGAHFCSGFDFSAYQEKSQADLVLRLLQIQRLLAKVRSAPCITMALVKGATFGAGADIALSCSIRVGIEGCQFKFPGADFGILLGTRYLTRLVGRAIARKILLSSGPVSDVDSLKYGLLTQLYEPRVDEVAVVNDTVRTLKQLTPQTSEMINKTDYSEEESLADLGRLVDSAAKSDLHPRIRRYLNER